MTSRDMSHLDRLGPSVEEINHQVFPMPPGLSITAVVVRELDGKDDLAIGLRMDTSNPMSELQESVRQSIVAYTTVEVPRVPIIDEDGDQIGFEWDLTALKPADWVMVESPSFAAYERWSLMTRRMVAQFYRQLNTIDVMLAGKAVASGQAWSPTTRRTHVAATESTPPRPASATTAGSSAT